MKRLFLFLIIACVSAAAFAQPKTRKADARKKSSTQSAGMTLRAREMFPTAVEMPEDVVWRRDIYRELDLMQEANATGQGDEPLHLPFQTRPLRLYSCV